MTQSVTLLTTARTRLISQLLRIQTHIKADWGGCVYNQVDRIDWIRRYQCRTTVRFDVSYGLVCNDAYRIIRYLKTEDLGITWKVTPEDRKAGFADMIFGAVDSSFAIDPVTDVARQLQRMSRRSLPGYLQKSRIELVTLKATIDRHPEFSRSRVCGAGRYNLRGEMS